MYPELLLLIGISLSLGFAPGPNNAVASYSAFNFGLRKTLPVIWGVGLGYTTLVVLLIFVLMSVFEKYLNVKSSVVVEDAGHSVHRKKPLEVANAIKDFLTEIS